MNREIEFFELRTVKIAEEEVTINKFKKIGSYTDGHMNKYEVYTTDINKQPVTFLKNKYDLLCTRDKEYFKINEMTKGALDSYVWNVVAV